ncbi:MAG: hypothetical protein BWY88_01434 [Synergistetes bacterium ADurb.Bin520]|nr:MAG: hypothetical protein BWY88_01434 [Synergistetes bacterium ADurb.Bin520]
MENFYQNLSISDWTFSIDLKNDTRNAQSLTLQTIYANDEPLLAYGELVADRKRLILARGAIERADGTVLCVGEGKYVPLPEEEQKNVIHYAGWGDRLEEAYRRIQEARKGAGEPVD